MHIESDWVEVKHDQLLTEPEPTKRSMNHILNVVVQGLFDVDSRRVDQHGMLSDLGQCHHSLLEFDVAPPLLNPIGGSPLDDHVDGVLLEGAAEEGCADVLLHHGDGSGLFEERLEEA